MDHKFTDRLKEWLDAEPEDRDYAQGALLLLRLSGNRILFNNISADPDRYRDIIEHDLRKYYEFRLLELTHLQVVEMEKQVDKIVDDHLSLYQKAAPDGKEPVKGKRPDHDRLPDEIKAKYIENLSLLRRMRELHLKLRSLSTEDVVCPDSERYPFLKELISLDKKLHANWKDYDRYVIPNEKNARN